MSDVSGDRDGQPGGPDAGGPGSGAEVAALRDRIQAVDTSLVELVAERLELARRIGGLKRRRSSATLDPGREAAVIRHAVEVGREHGLPEEPIRELFWTVVGLCRSAQIDG